MAVSIYRLRRVASCFVAVAAVSVSLASCQLAKNQLEYDRSGELTRQDYRDLMAPAPQPERDPGLIPDFQAVLSTPEDLRLPSPLVTVAVNQTVSLRDLIFELADQADVDIELDPQIRGSIIFTAKDRPFDQVVNRICEMAGLRYTFEDNVLRIELDRPYVHNYHVDYLNIKRESDSNISTEISMSTAAGETASSGGGGGSSSNITTKVEGGIWEDLIENIEQILASSDTHLALATLSDPVAESTNPFPVPYQMSDDPNLPPVPGAAGPMSAGVAPQLTVNVPPAEPLVPNPPATFSVSQKAGVISVFASQRQQRLVKRFLDEFRRRATTQILIEAKVLQVELADEFSTGVDWSQIDLGTNNLRLGIQGLGSPGLTPPTNGLVTMTLDTNDVNLALQAISRFGTVRALSSPRVTVLNNQPAVVNVAQNHVYFNYEVETQDATDSTGTRTSINSEQKSVPEGVIMTVVPIANVDTGEIQMIVRPTISKITGTVVDPTISLSLALSGALPDLIANNISIPVNNIPEVAVQEIDSLVRMQSGQMVVMGGLMKDSNTIDETGVPIMGDIPFVGSLFKSKRDKVEKTELVIFIKASIVSGGNMPDDMDRKLYRSTSLDRRPGRM